MSAARRDLDWSATSACLLFDGDDAVLHNAVETPSRRGHRSLPAVVAHFLCGQTFSLHMKYPLLLPDFNQTLICLTFSKNL